MKQLLKRSVLRRYPSLVAAYHAFRAARETFHHPDRPTPFGFRMSGHGSMQSGGFERWETALVREILPGIRTFVDVGANVGFFSCLARQAGCHVVAVEPSEQNLGLLLGNLAANGWTDVEVYPLALSKQAGIVTLYGDGTGASMIRRWSGTSDVWRRLVPASTLDVLLDRRFSDERLMIKIDVEGLEYSVLSGAVKTLKRQPSPIWLIEVCLTEHHPGGKNPDFAAVFETFWRHGYEARTADADRRRVYPEDVSRWIATGRRDFGWINFLFTRDAAA